MTTAELLADLHRQGFILKPVAGDRIIVRPFSKLSEEIRQELKRRKAEVLALLTSPFPCPSCQGAVRLEPALPEEHSARIWTCVHCKTWGVTRIGAPGPTAWVSVKTMH